MITSMMHTVILVAAQYRLFHIKQHFSNFFYDGTNFINPEIFIEKPWLFYSIVKY